MQNATDVIATYGLDGIFTYISPAIVTLIGRTPEELIGRSTFSLIHPDDHARVALEFKALLRSGARSARIEYRALRADGSAVWVEAHPSPVLGPDGRITGLQDVARDISARRAAQEAQEAATRRAEAALEAAQASEARFRLLAENANDMVATMSPDSTVLFATPAVFRLLGYTPEEVAGRKTLSLTHPDDIAGSIAHFTALIAAGPGAPPAPYRFRGRHKNGAWVWLEGQPRIEFDAAGAPVRFQDVVRDVSERVAATQAAEAAAARAEAARVAALESERLYRLLAENANDMIGRYSMLGHIQFISPSCHRVTGFAAEELLGRRTIEFMHQDDVERVQTEYRAYVAAGPQSTPLETEFRIIRKDGAVIWLEGRPKVVWSEAGEALAVCDVVREITSRKQLEQQLDGARRAAEAAATAKSDFMANMSHELRTPLTGILGYAHALAGSPLLDAESRRQARLIGEAGRGLLLLVNDVLDMAKIEAGSVALDLAPVALRGLASGAADLVRQQAEEKGLRLQCDLPGEEWTVRADARRLRQVLLNLLTNAVKFTAAGEVRLAMRCSAADGRVALHIEVSDTGIGIAADRLARVFARFEQADNSITRRFGGTGLGLAISHALVEAMGGTIAAASRPGRGSRFTVSLSLDAAVQAVAMPAPAPAPALAPAPDGLAGLRVLVADDVDMNRDVIRLFLEARGVRVRCVENGAQAVAAVRDGAFDVVLMDVHMPVLDGLQATRAIRAHRSIARIPILALTASVLPDEVARCHAAGMDGHIGKPFTPDALAAAVAAASRVRADCVIETSSFRNTRDRALR